MSMFLAIQELAIVIAVKNHSSNLFVPDVLQSTGVIPSDWQLAKPASHTETTVQLFFQNGVSLIAQPTAITFIQPVQSANPETIQVPAIARRYLQVVSRVDYQAIGINPKGVVTFPTSQPASRPADQFSNYISRTLMAQGPWQRLGNAPIQQAALNLVYQLDACIFRLMLEEAAIHPPDQPSIPALLCSGNFHYELTATAQRDRLAQLIQVIDNWRKTLQLYQTIINQAFLPPPSSNGAQPTPSDTGATATDDESDFWLQFVDPETSPTTAGVDESDRLT